MRFDILLRRFKGNGYACSEEFGVHIILQVITDCLVWERGDCEMAFGIQGRVGLYKYGYGWLMVELTIAWIFRK